MDQTDRARFDRAIGKLLYSLNGTARVSPPIAGAYWSILKGYDWTRVAAAMTVALREKTGHVTPAELANLCRPDPDQARAAADISRGQRLQNRMDQADAAAAAAGEKRHGTAWFNEEFRAMLDVANMEYGRRCTGRPVGGLRFPTIDVKGYDGRFDYMAIVLAAPVAKGKSPNKQAKAWEEFWTMLREEFQQYQALSETAPDAL